MDIILLSIVKCVNEIGKNRLDEEMIGVYIYLIENLVEKRHF